MEVIHQTDGSIIVIPETKDMEAIAHLIEAGVPREKFDTLIDRWTAMFGKHDASFGREGG